LSRAGSPAPPLADIILKKWRNLATNTHAHADTEQNGPGRWLQKRETMSNITQIQSAIAPILAPVAPAVLFGNNLHAGMIADKVDPTLAGFAAVLGTGGVELSGALACSMAVMAYHKRDYKIMWVSIAAALVYAVFVMVGIAQARNTSTFAGAVIISLVAYLMQGVWQSYNNKLQTAQAETALRVAEMEAQRKLTNAETRKAKAGAVIVQRPAVSSGGGHFVADPAMIAKIQDYWNTHPSASLREAAVVCGCSPTTAGKYKP
jgi:amino acid transporter